MSLKLIFPFLHIDVKLSTTNATAFRLLKSTNFIMIEEKYYKVDGKYMEFESRMTNS